MNPLEFLRSATEDHVALALHRAHVSLPITTEAEALEFYSRMLDVMTGEDDAADFQDEQNIRGARPEG